MRQGIALIIAVLILSVPGLAFAQAETEAGVIEHKDMPKEHCMKCKEHGMKCAGAKPGCPIMASIMERKVIATTDGGVVVVMGNKLTKYDQDLDMVKEVELTTDIEGLKKMMEGAKAGCPMGKEKGAMENKEEAKPVAAEPSSVEPAAAETTPEATAQPASEEPAAVPTPAAEPAAATETPAVTAPATESKPEAPAGSVTEEAPATDSSETTNTVIPFKY